ncbi:helix-turn-helix domain-containing protein [Rhodospirillaceae bacterium KN72]|uniref:Helix-turn-helix domain-containing protein n=1 Tax=Pacificispira spongiicola TaxID=2729598 RepID=A0A7Y0E3A3_9PROT|nr:helix-turn-helix domain-containing protein [Pacificispira spongiicola]NMM46452.1 helix-turn-helix domain-containing protein [Pacificispira spongiicola]
MEANETNLSADLLKGVAEIAEFLGEDERRTSYLCRNRSIPAFQIGQRWYARRSSLRGFIDRLESGAAA